MAPRNPDLPTTEGTFGGTDQIVPDIEAEAVKVLSNEEITAILGDLKSAGVTDISSAFKAIGALLAKISGETISFL